MSDSAIDVIKLGIEYILLAIFLIFVSQVVQIRNSYAMKINNREAQESATNDTLEFSMYDTDKPISGDEVIACIRNYSDGSIVVYVDRHGIKKEDNKDGINVPVILDSDGGGIRFDTEKAYDQTLKKMFTRKWLTDHIYLSESYQPHLIYDGRDVTDSRNYDKKGQAITGIAFIKED